MVRQFMAALVIGASLAFAGAVQATEVVAPPKPISFNWLSKPQKPRHVIGQKSATIAAINEINKINRGASWVCSPAGFGKKSRCHRGSKS